MVQKIQIGEYGKKYWNMTAAERQTYQDRVGQWLRSDGRMLLERADDFGSRLQNVMGVSVSWNDNECAAFEDGARLLSVLVGVSETWLPELLYAKSARRAIRQMVKCLKKGVPAEKERREKEPTPALPKGVSEKVEVPTPRGVSESREERKPTPAIQKGGGEKREERGKRREERGKRREDAQHTAERVLPLPVRPKHIDQYVHLLPKKTQDRAGQVRELLRDLDVARENARKLMDAGEQGDKVAQWAKKATSLDDKVRSIYKELDAEWEKLVKSGRVTVDVFGNASVAPDGKPSGTVATDGVPSGTVAEQEKPELTTEQKHRRRELRKWLIDTRRGAEGKARERRIEQWKVNIREYLTLEPIEAALKDEKIVAAAKHYGVSLRSDE